VSLGRREDAVSMFERAQAQVEDRLGRGGTVFPTEIADLVTTGAHVAELMGEPGLLKWALHLHARVPCPVTPAEIRALERTNARFGAELAAPIAEVIRALSGVAADLQGEIVQLRAIAMRTGGATPTKAPGSS
jgi:hypothetical protein